MPDVFFPFPLGLRIVIVRSLVEGKLGDFPAELYGRFKSKSRTRGMTIERSRPASVINQRFNILNLPFDCIGLGVATVARPRRS